jgi:hypothetical protein
MQQKAERVIVEFADRYSGNLGMDRRDFLRTACGMAAIHMGTPCMVLYLPSILQRRRIRMRRLSETSLSKQFI